MKKYLTTGCTLIATKPIKVFIEKNSMNLPIEKTNIGKIPKDSRFNLSWKGCYYIIAIGEEFIYNNSNNYDLSYFSIKTGNDFKIECGDPILWISRNEVIIK